MILRQLPFAQGHATILCPFFPLTAPGRRRYKSHVAVCLAQLFIDMPANESSPQADMLDGCIAQAIFFDRAALLPWAMQWLGRLQLDKLEGASLAATWEQQIETVQVLQNLGLISEGQALTLERSACDRVRATLLESRFEKVDNSGAHVRSAAARSSRAPQVPAHWLRQGTNVTAIRVGE